MRKASWFLMASVCALIVPGCGVGSGIGAALLDGGLSLGISLVWSLISGSLSTPAA